MDFRHGATPRTCAFGSFGARRIPLGTGRAAALAQTGTIGVNFTGVTLIDGVAVEQFQFLRAARQRRRRRSEQHRAADQRRLCRVRQVGTSARADLGRDFWTSAGVTPGNDGSNLATTLGAFNARVIYDPTSSRWIAAELSGETTNNSVMLARSDTSDPTGPWHAVSFLGNAGGTGQFVDYTRLGVDANGVYVSTNNFASNGGDFDSVSLFSLPKADLLAAHPSVANLSRFDALVPTTVGLSMQPVINFGASNGSALVLGTTPFLSENALYLSTLTSTATATATLANSQTVGVLPYTSPPAASQPGAANSISTIDDRFTANVYQVGHFVYGVNATTYGNNAAITWYKMDTNTNEVVQQGTFNSPNFDYFQPSIAANANGNLVITFTRSGSGAGGNLSLYAVVARTGANGQVSFGTPFLLQAGTVSNYNFDNGRWGDYATTVVDPTEPQRLLDVSGVRRQQFVLGHADLRNLGARARRHRAIRPGPGRPGSVRLAPSANRAWHDPGMTRRWRAKNTTAKIYWPRPRRWSNASACSAPATNSPASSAFDATAVPASI